MRKYLALCFCALLALASCTQEIEGDVLDAKDQARQTLQAVTLDAYDADAALATKTERAENGSVLWTPGDAINLFYGASEGPGSHFVAENTVATNITKFRGYIEVVTGIVEGATDLLFWGIYPYNEGNSCNGTSATIQLQQVQRSGENSWGEGALVSLGRSQGLAMGFYNLLGGIAFYVTDDNIEEIVFRGKDSEPVAGPVTVTFVDNVPAITSYQDTAADLHLLPPGEYQNETFKKTTPTDTTWYFMVLPPRVYTNGHTVTFYKNDGTYGVREFGKRTVTRNNFTRIRSTPLNNGVEFVPLPSGLKIGTNDATGGIYDGGGVDW